MERHFSLTDQEFEEQFALCKLDPAIFSHEAHIRLAWLHIHNYGEHKAIHHITTQLKNYVQALGASEKYNETLTVAAIKAVYHFYQKKYFAGFHEFISAYPRLKHDFKEILSQHYAFDIFNSPKAKIKYLQPDLLAFS